MDRLERYVIAFVILHLVAVLVHTVAHIDLQILPSAPDTVFIVAVILVGPVAALPLLRFSRAFAGGFLAVLMVSAFAYGLQGHFLAPGPDNIAMGADPFTILFVTTAVAIGILEIALVILAIALFAEATRTPSGSSAQRT